MYFLGSRKRGVRIILIALVMVLLSSMFTSFAAEHSDIEDKEYVSKVPVLKEGSYDAYLAEHQDHEKPNVEVLIDASQIAAEVGMTTEVVSNFEGMSGSSLWTDEEGSVTWQVDVPVSGLYNIGITYYPVEGKTSAIERQLLIDGEEPFFEANHLIFQRVWANASDEIRVDNRGNELTPVQKEVPIWQEAVFRDVEGYYEEPYQFYLTKGQHTIELVSLREPMLIHQLKLFQVEEPLPYEEVAKKYEEQGLQPVSDFFLKLQGEKAVRKSDPTLYPTNDRISPATEPYDVSEIRMNMIGDFNWRMPGQWIEWEVDVPKDGLYQLVFKARQNFNRGMYSSRSLMIDGEYPFLEAKDIMYEYSSNWGNEVIGDKDGPYLIHLTEGQHTIRLEVILGQLAPLLRDVQTSVLTLSELYRQIIKITGTTPDPYRDYQLVKQIPGLEQRFREQSDVLYNVANSLAQVTDGNSENVAVINKAAYQLKDLADRPLTIQNRLKTFKDNISAIGAWILKIREQPLSIDYVLLTSPEAKLPKADASWFGKMKHEFLSFLNSFFTDYDSIGNVAEGDEVITVWIGTGRDQAQVLKKMIDDTFTPETGIQVNLRLVNMGMLLPATLAGEGPDAVMQIGNDIPVNYAMRNAAEDLSKYPGFAEVESRFLESAVVPYRYNNGVYALPEQQIFTMLFYRKDIIDPLGIEVPQTWEDMYNMLPILEKNYMELGLPLEQNFTRQAMIVPNQTYAMLLFQNDGQFYSDNGKKSGMDTEVSMQAFLKWVQFYNSYKLPMTFDFPTRFRTGEMPIGIADYTMYNYLTVSAPEIRGLWNFAPVPGTVQEDGTIRRDSSSSGTGVMMLKNAKNKDSTWEFMNWWTSKDAQVRFGREMEGLMGAAARYPTANVEALAELPWPVKDYRALSEQLQWVHGIPEVPGGYFTGRHLDNAFRLVVNDNQNARETLYFYTQYVDDEIEIKRREFNLDP